MPRLFIADSEDEDDDAPESPPRVALPSLANGQSSDPLSRGTDSTDTAFFRSVYHEQTEAVQQRARTASKDDHPASPERGARGGDMWDVPSSPGPQPGSDRRKRRKLSNEHDNGASKDSSMLPPTLQIEDEAAFVITPNAMTKSQRDQYQSAECPSSLDQDTGPALQMHGQRMIDLTSSSSGTNFNTPRTIGTFTQPPPTQDVSPKRKDRDGTVASRSAPIRTSTRGRRLSSPDLIAVADTTDVQDHYEPQSSGPVANEESGSPANEPDNGVDFQEPIIIENEDSPFEEEPVKAKKKRGRPKKTETSKPTAKKESTPQKAISKEKAPKKKRGRPKKDVATSEETIADQEAATADNVESLVGGASHDQEPEKVSVEAVEPHPVKQNAAENIDEKTSEADIQQHREEVKEDVKPAVQDLGSKASMAELRQAKPAGVKDDGKPIYRVGLSKRTRIAPLLKMIRK